MMVMGKVTTKKLEPETPQARASRVVPGPEPFTDLNADIQDPQYPFLISSINPELFKKCGK